MRSNFTSWFDESAYSDAQLRIFQLCPRGAHPPDSPAVADATSPDKATLQALDTDLQTPDGTQHAHTASSSALNSKQDTVTAQWPVRIYHAHAVILSAQSAYFAACLGTNWQQQRHRKQRQQQGDASCSIWEAHMVKLLCARSALFRSSLHYLSEGCQRLSCAALAAAAAAVVAAAGATARRTAAAVAALRWATIVVGASAVLAMVLVTRVTVAGVAAAATTLFIGATIAAAMAATTSTPAVGVTIDITLQPDELDAMDLMLRFMYGFDLPAVSPQTTPTLIHCLLLADRFDVPNCVDALLTHIKGTTPSVELFCAPPGITGRPDFAAFLDAAKRFVVGRYRNVPAVIRSEQLRQEFCALPFAAVLAWAESDELRVHSENCVVYLLSTWVQAAQRSGGQGVSADQLEQLAQQVRVLHLGPAYQQQILPQLGWFKESKCSVHLPTLLALTGKDRSGNPVYLADAAAGDQIFPAQWVANARQRIRVTEADQLLSWEVGGWQLDELCTGKRISSPPLYNNGFMFRMEAVALTTYGGCAKTLCLYMGVDSVQADGAIPWPETAVVTFGYVDTTVLYNNVRRLRPACVQMGTRMRGAGDLLSRAVPSASELVAPYLKDGKLYVGAEFLTVDTS